MAQPIPESEYAVLKDRERGHIIDSGRYHEMIAEAESHNTLYQSTAYVVERWRS